MHTVVNDPTNPRYAPLIQAAFGTSPNLDMGEVQRVVGAMRTGSVVVHPEAHTYPDPNQHAHTEFRQQQNELKPTNIKLGTSFFSKYFSTSLCLWQMIIENTPSRPSHA
jgi:hypothetical protein